MAAMSDKDKEARKKQLKGYLAAGALDISTYEESPYKDKTRDAQTRKAMSEVQRSNEKELTSLERPPMSKKWTE